MVWLFCGLVVLLGVLEMESNANNQILQLHLYRHGGIDEERIVVERVIHEIVAQFYLRADADVPACVVPQLRLCEQDELAVPVLLLAPPEVYEAGESDGPAEKRGAPHPCQLT